MYDPITTQEFNGLLHMAVEKHNLDPENTYIEFTWWDKKYWPLDITDCNWKKSEFIMVFGDTLCNTFYKNSDGYVIPTGFWILENAAYVDKVIHRPMTVSKIMDSKFMLQFDTVKFLFSNSPINYYVDINPYKTRIYKNRGGETILALYAEDRDSGEWQPISGMKPDHIMLIDNNPPEFKRKGASDSLTA